MSISMGERIKQARLQKGLTADELAYRVGSTRSTITHYEINRRGTKRVDATLIVKLAKELNLSIDYIFLGKK